MDSDRIHHLLDSAPDDATFHQFIVDAPFQNRLYSTSLGLGVVVLLLADYEKNALRRIALSNTEMAAGAVKYSVKRFHEIVIPLDYTDNILVKAIATKRSQYTIDWATMFNPVLSPEEARLNQAGAGIGCSYAYPLLTSKDARPLGTLIFSYFEPLGAIGRDHRIFMKTYSDAAAEKLASLKK